MQSVPTVLTMITGIVGSEYKPIVQHKKSGGFFFTTQEYIKGDVMCTGK